MNETSANKPKKTIIRREPTFDIEINFQKEGYLNIAGVDEVGRGSIAGPIVAGAVVFADYQNIDKYLGIMDSKILTPNKRDALYDLIIKEARHYSLGVVQSEDIDRIGIGAANILAFKRALDGLNCKCGIALIDGRKFHGFDYHFACFEQGESKSLSIAAASILAKVFRDRLMEKYAVTYPEYLFELNKGYGSSSHWETLKEKGPTPIHRKTFIQKYLEDKSQGRLF